MCYKYAFKERELVCVNWEKEEREREVRVLEKRRTTCIRKCVQGTQHEEGVWLL